MPARSCWSWLIFYFFMLVSLFSVTDTKQKQTWPACRDILFYPLPQTDLICWDKSGQMVRRLLFLYLYHRSQQWQKGGEHLGAGEVVTTACMSVTDWLAAQATTYQPTIPQPPSNSPSLQLSVRGHLGLSAREGHLCHSQTTLYSRINKAHKNTHQGKGASAFFVKYILEHLGLNDRDTKLHYSHLHLSCWRLSEDKISSRVWALEQKHKVSH